MKNPNGYGTVYKLSGNRRRPYVAQVTTGYDIQDGKCIQKRMNIGYYGTRKEAMMALAKYNNHPDVVSKYTVGDIIDRWKVKAFTKIKESTQISYKNTINQFSDILTINCNKLTKQALDTYIERHKIAQSTLTKFKVILKCAYDIASDDGITDIDYSFLKRLETSVPAKKIVRKTAELESIQTLWNKNDEMSKIMLVLLYTGMRISEFLALTKEDVFEDSIRIKASKTDSGVRDIPLCFRIRQIASEMFSDNGFDIFSEKMSYIQKYNAINSTAALYDIHIHDTRHTFISKSVELGIPQQIIKSVVGHKDKDTTSIYTHISLPAKIEAYKNFDY